MRSQLAVRLGSQEPVVLHTPPDVASLAAAEEAIELADAYGICDGSPLSESQKITLRGAMAERADGTWAATRIGDFGPRQGTGKNDKIAARELAGLILLGEPLIIHTAHEFPTANEAFLRLVALFENYDDLRKRVSRILYGNGTQSINLRTGQRILYKARTGGSARGFTKAALVVYDEAQHLVGSHVAASAPAKLANPNAQSWFAGSGGLETSAKAWEMRRAAILGTGGRLAYTEMTAETIEIINGKIVCHAPDPLDLDAWYRAMPGLGRWVTEESMRALYDELGADDFAREGLCVWDPEPGAGGAMSMDAWAACGDVDHRSGPSVEYAVDVAPEGRSAAVAAGDGTHIEIVKHAPTIAWVVPSIIAKKDRLGSLGIVLDPAGPAGELVAPLEAAGVTVTKLSTEQAKAACGQFMSAVNEQRLRHIRQSMLDSAAANAAQRDVGDGGWLWSRLRSQVDICPLVAATWANYAAGISKPEPTPAFVSLEDFLDEE